MTSPQRIASRYGVHPSDIHEVPGGVANRAYTLGNDLFLRIPRAPGTANWLLAWFDRLATRFDREAPNVLLHGDLAPQNLMVDDKGQYCALIDWGDAAWGPRGAEFAKLRLEQVAQLLPSYGGEGQLEAAVLWFHLSWGLSGLTGPPRLHQRHWTAPPASRLLGVLRFFSGNPPASWSELY